MDVHLVVSKLIKRTVPGSPSISLLSLRARVVNLIHRATRLPRPYRFISLPLHTLCRLLEQHPIPTQRDDKHSHVEMPRVVPLPVSSFVPSLHVAAPL